MIAIKLLRQDVVLKISAVCHNSRDLVFEINGI
jgi:hypothetical protein